MSRAAINNPRCGPWQEEPDDPDQTRCMRCDSMPHHTCPIDGVQPRLEDDLTRLEEEHLARFMEQP